MSALDTLAAKAHAASERLGGEGGVKAKIAHELADDAVFLRKLKPALVKKRLKGHVPANQPPGEAPTGPGGPSPFLVVGVALALGVVAAKVIDWRSHGHPLW